MPFLILLTGLLSWFPPGPTVEVILTSSCPPGGRIHLAVYDSEKGFEEKKEIYSMIKDCKERPVIVRVPLPARGRYILAAFQDLNGNGVLDTSIFGAPLEPYGFATPPPSRWRSPSFSEIATDVTEDQLTASITLKKWKQY